MSIRASNHDYLVGLSRNGVERKIIIHSENELTLDLIQRCAQSVLNQVDEKNLTEVDWKSVQQGEGFSSPDVSVISMREIKVQRAERVEKRAYLTLWGGLLKKWPTFVPGINLVWAFGICPFIALRQWLSEDRRVAEAGLTRFYDDIHIDTPEKFFGHLEAFQKTFSDGLVVDENDFSDQLNQGLEWGRALENALTNNVELQKTITNIRVEIDKKLNDAKDGQNVCMIPLGLRVEGKYQPLMLSIQKTSEGFDIRFHQWGSQKAENLAEIYSIEGRPVDKLEEILNGLLQPAIQSDKRSFELSAKEKRRLEIIGRGRDEKDIELERREKQDPYKALHETILLMGGKQKELPPDEIEKNPTSIYLMMQRDLFSFFPEVSIQDKTEYLLSMISEEAELLLEASPQLSGEIKARRLSNLIMRVEKFEREFKRTLKHSGEVADLQIFKEFYEKIDRIKEEYEALSKKMPVGREQALSSARGKSKQVFSAQIDAGRIVKPGASRKGEKVKRLAQINVDGIDFNRPEELADKLKEVHEQIDKLIEKGEYLAAKRAAESALGKLPVIKQGGLNGHPNPDFLSEQIANLTKDIWESALKLNMTYPESNQLVQMMKAQIYIVELLRAKNAVPNSDLDRFQKEYTLDKEEMKFLIERHPHLRFGWLPKQREELSQIMDYLDQEKNKTVSRLDVSSYLGYQFPMEACSRDKKLEDKEKVDPGLIDFRRAQLMMTSLVKPDYSLIPFIPYSYRGAMKAYTTFLREERKAKEAGITDRKQIKAFIKANKLAEVQKNLKGMRRLDIAPGEFVTERMCFNIVDPTGKSSSKIAYLPNGMGFELKELEDRFGFLADENNSEGSVGKVIGLEGYIAETDQKVLDRPQNITSTVGEHTALTEPTALRNALQKEPEGLVSQTDNFLLNTMQIVNDDSSIYSAIETLTTFLQEKHQWDNPEVQRAILLALTRHGVLSKERGDNGEFFRQFASKLKEILKENEGNPKAYPFILLVGHIFNREMDNILFPGFETDVKIGDTTQKGEDWIRKWLKDEEKNDMMNAMCLLFARFEDCGDLEDLDIFQSLIIFSLTESIVGIPQFNGILKESYERNFLEPLRQKFSDDPAFVNKFMNDYMKRIDPVFTPTSWKYNSKKGLVESHAATLNLNSLSFKAKGKKSASVQVELPPAVSKSDEYIKLFGAETLRAEMERGKTQDDYLYAFDYNNQSYQITYDQSTGEAAIYRQMAANPHKPAKQQWYQYISLPKSGSGAASTIEKMMEESGLWVNVSNPKKALLKTHLPKQETEEKDMYLVRLDKEGRVDKVSDPATGHVVVLDPDDTLSSLVPFASKDHLLFLGSGKSIKEVRLIHNGSRLVKKGRGRWFYVDEKLGKGYRWLTDRCDRDIHNIESDNTRKIYEALGPDAGKFLLPLVDEKQSHFLVFPHRIEKSRDLEAPYRVDTGTGLSAVSQYPLKLSMDHEGKLSGPPSAFLYLAYFYSTQKDFPRALRYLKDAGKAHSESPEEERKAFEYIAELIDNHPSQSMRAIGFQLKAQAAIDEIRGRMFGARSYEIESLDLYMNHILRVYSLRKLYLEKIERHEIQAEEIENEGLNLTAREESVIQKMIQTSMGPFSDLFKEQLFASGAITRPEGVEKLPEIDLKGVGELDEKTMFSLLFLAKDLKKQKPLDELLHGGRPTEEMMIRHFFKFYSWIANPRTSKKEQQAILRFLLEEPAWDASRTSDADAIKRMELAEKARKLLIALTAVKLKTESSFEELDLNKLNKKRDSLKKFSKLIDITSHIRIGEIKIGDLLFVFKNRDEDKWDDLKADLGKVINPIGYNNYNINELRVLAGMPKLQARKQQEDKIKLPGDFRQVTTPRAIYDYLKNGDRSQMPFLPIEIDAYIDLLEEEFGLGGISVDKDADKAVQLTEIAENKMGGTRLIELRAEAEHMKQIVNLEGELNQKAAPLPRFEKLTEVQVAPLRDKMEQAQKALKNINQKTFTQKSEEKKRNDDLKTLIETAKTSFNSENVEDPIEKEEYNQLCKGFDSAGSMIAKEIKSKTQFTKGEVKSLRSFVAKELDPTRENSMKWLRQQEKENLLKFIEENEGLPPSLVRIKSRPKLYTDYDLINEAIRLYKDGRVNEGFDIIVTKYLLFTTAVQQLENASSLLQGKKVSRENVSKALGIVNNGVNLGRYLDEDNQNLVRMCLAAEAREGIIYRKRQLDVIKTLADDPSQWCSLRMGIGKTSYIMPTVADILSGQGKLPVLTVPEQLLRSNRSAFDRTTRDLFDRASLEFTVPMQESIPINHLAELYEQLLRAKRKKGYLVTSVEELCSLDNTIVQLEDRQLKILEQLTVKEDEDLAMMLAFNEKRLHYLKKIAQFIHGESEEFAIPAQFFGDEVDYTGNITHEVNLAVGEKVDPDARIREVVRGLLECLLVEKEEGSLQLQILRNALLNDTQTVLSEQEIEKSLESFAASLQRDPVFLELCKAPDWIKELNPELWVDYMTAKEGKELGDWTGEEWQKRLAAARQVISSTLKGMLTQKSGNDYGLSDFNGYMVVPKICKNETEGMRFGDEFDLVAAQYLGYFAFLPAKSLTDRSDTFMQGALKQLKEKYPSEYQKLDKDYKAAEAMKDDRLLTLYEYLQSPEAWRHRWNILDHVVFGGGYIKRFDSQVKRNVQDMMFTHEAKSIGGVTGTLDTYTLPFIDTEKQFSEDRSTREVEAETILRLCLNNPDGIAAGLGYFQDDEALAYVRGLLADKETTAIINNSGATSEGLNAMTWIAKLRKTPEGKHRSYLFMHPEKRVVYYWDKEAKEPVRYQGQPLGKECICMYAPSDTRGVDMPIQKGKVHLLLGPTTTTQDFMQSAYRARKLGGDHRLQVSVSESFYQKIGEDETLADVLKYIIGRSTNAKKELNLKAELHKVQGQLKDLATRWLRRDNTDMSDPGFWKEGFEEDLLDQMLIKGLYFNELRDMFIISKKIDYELCFAPKQTISGIEKIEDAYDNLRERIAQLAIKVDRIEKLQRILPYKQLEKEDFDEVRDKAKDIVMSIFQDPSLSEKYSDKLQKILPELQRLDPENLDLESLTMKELETFVKDGKANPAINALLLLDEFVEILKDRDVNTPDLKVLELNPVVLKGKENLHRELRLLRKHLKEMKKEFTQKAKKHEKYLPEKTAKAAAGNSGTFEQVRELQQEKAQEIEVEAEAADDFNIANGKKRSYKPIRQGFDLKPPFEGLSRSPEAKALLEVFPKPNQAGMLFYLMISGDKVMLITKQDYHREIKYKANNVQVFSMDPFGFTYVNGSTIPPKEALFQKMVLAKIYLGVHELTQKEKATLADMDLSGLDDFATPSQRKLFKEVKEQFI